MPSYGKDLILFFLMLLINAVISVGYYLLSRFVFSSKESKSTKDEKDKKHSLRIRLIVMLVVPVVGPIYFIVSWLVYKVFFSEPVDLEDVIFSKDKVKFNVRAEEEKERNLTSLEEAVEVTDKRELRTLMMSVVGGDIQKFLSSINFALTSDDSETAHYAASVMQDALNDFRVNVAKRYKKLIEDEENKAIHAEALIEYMNAILEQKVFIDLEQRDYVNKLDEVADILYDEARDRITEEHMEKVALRLLETEEFDKCEKWCDRLKIIHPLTLATYTCRLKLYFNMGRKDEFFVTIEELKSSSVVIDKETLELIRVFRNN